VTVVKSRGNYEPVNVISY